MDTLPLSEREFSQYRDLLHQLVGIHLSDAKRALVSSRLAKRIQQCELNSYGEYFQCLMQDKSELQVAVDLLTTNETYFFREPSHFDFLRNEITPLLRSNPVRIWCAACSSGEEPYSIAITMAESMGSRPWEVLASDVNAQVLETARAGIYPMASAADIPHGYLVKYCLKGIREEEGKFVIAPALQARVYFEQINLNQPLPNQGEFDVIFLRNVLIYFNQETKHQVVQRLLAKLRPGGWFIVSHSENLNGVTEALQTVKPSIYRKLNT